MKRKPSIQPTTLSSIEGPARQLADQALAMLALGFKFSREYSDLEGQYTERAAEKAWECADALWLAAWDAIANHIGVKPDALPATAPAAK
jgi:hypothetical protein